MSRGIARIGALVPFTNSNLEPDLALLLPPGCTLHVARLGGYDAEALPDAAQMAGLGAAELDEPLRLLAGVRPDVILYGCTSATLTHGLAFDRDLSARAEAMSGAKTITAAGALLQALSALGMRRIGFASPYLAEINAEAIAFLAESGIETVSQAAVDEPLDNVGQGAMTPEAVYDLALQADSPQAEGLVLSCTDMRAVETIARLEQDLGKPVICSNQALVFAALRHLSLAPGDYQAGGLLAL
ncbi:MAG: Asp/Glu racemase [Pseudomonadota bacterium]